MDKLNDFARSNQVVDRKIDTLIRHLGLGNDLVLDARLGYYWIHDSFRVYLTADPDIAAQRIYKDISDGQRHEDGATTINQTILSIQRQAESTQERYFRDYGIDISNTNMFDLIINTDDKTPDEIVGSIKDNYRTWLRGE